MSPVDKKRKSKRPLLKIFERSFLKFPIKPKDKILVAVSGGADSVCLFHLLRKLSRRHSFSIHVAHLNHGFRKEAEREALFVMELAAAWEIPMTAQTISVPEICKEKHLSKQEGARQVRYQFLHKVAREVGANWIALGHTADDQAETFMMRLLRGAGPRGLGSIPAVREGFILRPLLGISREEILAELSINNLTFVEDPSNQHPIYLRNRIRHELLPLLAEYNPKVKEAFCQEAELLRDENDYMRHEIERILPLLKTLVTATSVRFDIAALHALHPALQRGVIRWGIERLHGSLRGIGFNHVEAVRSRTLLGQSGKAYSAPHGVRIEKRYSELFLEKQPSAEAPYKIPEIFLPSEGEVELPLWGRRVRMSRSGEAALCFSSCVASFDFDKINPPFSIRAWRSGDRLAFGRGSKKLQDIFVDAKIPRPERGRIPLLSSAEGILWVVGLRVNSVLKASERTRHTLVVEIEKL